MTRTRHTQTASVTLGDLLTTTQVAQRLGVPTPTLVDWRFRRGDQPISKLANSSDTRQRCLTVGLQNACGVVGMTATAARAERPRPDARQAAAEYIARGWAVVPVPRQSKHPVRRGWQKGGFTADDVNSSGNVGILLGAPSGGLIDVDLDAVESVAAGRYWLPETGRTHGRPSKRLSHFWYVVDDLGDLTRDAYYDPTLRDERGKLACLVELRGDKHQTVVPPSVHKSGEFIEWESESDPAHADLATLRSAVTRIAATALLASRWPAGARHECALALAGMLRRGGMELDDAVRFVEVVARVAGDEEHPDRARAARDTYAETGATTGGPTLASLIADGEAVVARLREWLGIAGTAPELECPRSLDLAEFLRVEFPPRENILEPVFPKQGLGMVHAWRGLGKTYFALSFGLAAAAGDKFLKWQASRSWNTLFVDGEMRGVDMQQRLASLVEAMGAEPGPSAFKIITPDLQPNGLPDLGTIAGQRWLESVIADRELLILDNLSSLVRTGDKEDEPWLPMLGWLLHLRASGRSALLVHHDGKSEQQRGTSRREDHLDTVFHLKKPRDYKQSEGARFVLHFEKHRGFYGPDAEPFEVTLQSAEDGGLTWTLADIEDALTVQVAEMLNDGRTVTQIANELKVGRATVDRHKKKAIEKGALSWGVAFLSRLFRLFRPIGRRNSGTLVGNPGTEQRNGAERTSLKALAKQVLSRSRAERTPEQNGTERSAPRNAPPAHIEEEWLREWYAEHPEVTCARCWLEQRGKPIEARSRSGR